MGATEDRCGPSAGSNATMDVGLNEGQDPGSSSTPHRADPWMLFGGSEMLARALPPMLSDAQASSDA